MTAVTAPSVWLGLKGEKTFSVQVDGMANLTEMTTVLAGQSPPCVHTTIIQSYIVTKSLGIILS
jgi:hypothetical protein